MAEKNVDGEGPSTKQKKSVQISPQVSPRVYSAHQAGNSSGEVEEKGAALSQHGGRSNRRASAPVTKEEKESSAREEYDPPERIPSILTIHPVRRESSPIPYVTRESYTPIGYPPDPTFEG